MITPVTRAIHPSVGYAYSNNFPFLSNAGTGEKVLSSSWTNASHPAKDILSWFAARNPLTFAEWLPLEPVDLQEIYNPDLLSLYAKARSRGDLGACNNPSNTTTFLCQVLVENGLWGALQNDIKFPTSLCYSEDDNDVGYVNFPTNLTNPFVHAYKPASAALAPRGSHLEANVFCALDPITAVIFGSSGANSAAESAKYNYKLEL